LVHEISGRVVYKHRYPQFFGTPDMQQYQHGHAYVIEYAFPHGHMHPEYFPVTAAGLCVRDFARGLAQELRLQDGTSIEIQNPDTGKPFRGSHWLHPGSAVQVQTMYPTGMAAFAAEIFPDTLPDPVPKPAAELPLFASTLWSSATVQTIAANVRRCVMANGSIPGRHVYVTVSFAVSKHCVVGMALPKAPAHHDMWTHKVFDLQWPPLPWMLVTASAIALVAQAIQEALHALKLDNGVILTDCVWMSAAEPCHMASAPPCMFVHVADAVILALRRTCFARLKKICGKTQHATDAVTTAAGAGFALTATVSPAFAETACRRPRRPRKRRVTGTTHSPTPSAKQ
jgi:hypothetical protein